MQESKGVYLQEKERKMCPKGCVFVCVRERVEIVKKFVRCLFVHQQGIIHTSIQGPGQVPPSAGGRTPNKYIIFVQSLEWDNPP